MNRFTRIRTPETDTAPTGGEAAVSIGAAMRARGAAARAATPAVPATVTPAAAAPVAAAPVEPVAAEPAAAPAEPISPEPAAAPVEPEAVAPAPAPALPDAVAAELAALRAELAALKGAAAPVAAPTEPEIPAVPVPASARFKTRADLERAEADTTAAVAHLRANRDGLEYRDGDRTVRLSADQVAAELDRLYDDLAIRFPREREAMREREAVAAEARRAYPTHFDAKHGDSAAVRAIFAEFPGIAGDHRAAAAILAGRKAAAAPARPAPARAPARPAPVPAAPVPAPVSAGAAPVRTIDRDAIARGEGGFGALLRRTRA